MSGLLVTSEVSSVSSSMVITCSVAKSSQFCIELGEICNLS